MGNKKALVIMLSMLFAITAVGASGYYIFTMFSPKTEAAEPTADELEELTVETEEITTNLLDDAYVKIKFKIQADSKDGKEELEKRLFQVNNTIIYEISGMKTDNLKGREGIVGLEKVLQKKISELMLDGKVVRVYTTQKIIQ
ncbi:flagellar basal body-associated protein FliL [Fictibacillus aquaticus]|uniref:Flagellar protein FliL n=2 Tax=Fictibacillus aquaticus TaxID=2021314 RepID=A0A235FBT9_9BACL|nr:flagellar basal body-associated protein FliL [Fictibacillus aquaticus]